MNLGRVLMMRDKLAEAARFLQEALGGYRRLRGEDDARTILCMSWFGGVVRDLGRLDEAELLCREAAERTRSLLSVRSEPAMLAILPIVLAQHRRRGR